MTIFRSGDRAEYPWFSGMMAGLLSLCLYSSSVVAGSFTAQSQNEADRIEAEVRAAQFLTRATFGARKSEVQSLADRIEAIGAAAAFEEWIDLQLVIRPSYQHGLAGQMLMDDGYPGFLGPNLRPALYTHSAWWHTVVTAQDQLRQRMAWALAQILVVNSNGANFKKIRIETVSGQPMYLGLVHYYDRMIEHAFGNYRDLLQDVTEHPIMGTFLSHVNNDKGDGQSTFPDENYAREVMQLFSIGLYKLQMDGQPQTDLNGSLIPTYTNAEIREFAKVFTGMHYAGSPFGPPGGSEDPLARINFHEPMAMDDDHHDMSVKYLLDGQTLPAGQSGEQDVSDALDILFNHQNVGPFVARLLIQRLVKSNPSRQYIHAVATAFNSGLSGDRGDLRAVVKAILLHPEAMESLAFDYQPAQSKVMVTRAGDVSGRLQEPVLRYTAFLRSLEAQSQHANGGRFMFWKIQDWQWYKLIGQDVYKAPSVFNFYRPDHIPQGPLQGHAPPGGVYPNDTVVAPEFQIMSATSTALLANRFKADTKKMKVRFLKAPNNVAGQGATYKYSIVLDGGEALALAAGDGPGQEGSLRRLFEHLDLYHCHGAMLDAERDAIRTVVEAELPNAGDAELRMKTSIRAVFTSPTCAVHG